MPAVTGASPAVLEFRQSGVAAVASFAVASQTRLQAFRFSSQCDVQSSFLYFFTYSLLSSRPGLLARIESPRLSCSSYAGEEGGRDGMRWSLRRGLGQNSMCETTTHTTPLVVAAVCYVVSGQAACRTIVCFYARVNEHVSLIRYRCSILRYSQETCRALQMVHYNTPNNTGLIPSSGSYVLATLTDDSG